MLNCQLDKNTHQLNHRFEFVKQIEIGQRKMIEKSLFKIRQTAKLKLAFLTFKNNFERAKVYSHKQKIGFKRYFQTLKRRFFHFWKVEVKSWFPKARKLEIACERQKKQISENNIEKLNILKSKILEVEQKIQLVEKSSQYFMNGISASYLQAIGLLQTELMSINKKDERKIKRNLTIRR